MSYSDQEPTSGDFGDSGDGVESQLGDANKSREERSGPGSEGEDSDPYIIPNLVTDSDGEFGQAAGVAGHRIDAVAATGWETVEEPDTTSDSASVKDNAKDAKN